MKQTARNHHFVAQMYLRQWAPQGHNIAAYRTLVSHPNVPQWTRTPIKGVAFLKHLYATPRGAEPDAFEKWLANEFEQPASSALSRAANDRELSDDDFRRLADFFAAQDVRTPRSYLDSRKRWEEQIPETLKAVVDDAILRIKESKTLGLPLALPDRSQNPFAEVLRVTLAPHDDDHTAVGVEVSSGRALWIATMRHLLTGKAIAALRRHSWSIAEPSEGAEWITSDHPALRLNYYEPGRYDFGGGWGNVGSELFLPLSPRHLLYTRVGRRLPKRFKFPPNLTRLIQKLLAERAHRWIFARSPSLEVPVDRPRVIDGELLNEEEHAWARWNEANLEGEEPS